MAIHLYDPLAPDFYEPAAARAERDRTFHICSDCRVCVKLCPSFRSLFEMIDDLGGTEHVDDLSDAQHTRVVDECYQCKLCYVICPYTPDQQQEWRVDFPQLMLRSLAVQGRSGHESRSARLLARTDLQGKVATAFAPLVNKMNEVKPARTLMEKVTGISRERLLPSFTKVRFSKWFRNRTAPPPAAPKGTVALFPTCLVEYQQPAIGKSMVGVYEHNGYACTLPEGQVCCGMPWLDAGDTEKFREHAQKNVDILYPAVKAGMKVVVPQPTCAYTLKDEVPAFLGTDKAREVAANTFEASEFLMNEHRAGNKLDTEFKGKTYESIVWHAACHYRAQQMGPKSAQLMKLTGAKVDMIERCAAIDGTWGLRAENLEMAKRVAKPLMEKLREAEEELVAGDCQLAHVAITEATRKTPSHPMQVMARAYGIEEQE